MKGCIFQKQEPVNIPQIETGVLTDVLKPSPGRRDLRPAHPLEPAALRRPHPAPYTGRKVLVVGLGPAGYTLAHYLLNEGFGVAGVDGLKIEPLRTTGRARTALDPPDPRLRRDRAAPRRTAPGRVRRRL
jgi:hypothetical protein